MPTSRAVVASPDPTRHARALVADLVARHPAALHHGTTEIHLPGGRLDVTAVDGAVRLDVSAGSAQELTALEDRVVADVDRATGPGVLAVEWWRSDGTVRGRAGDSRAGDGRAQTLGWVLGTRTVDVVHADRRTGRPVTTRLTVLRHDAETGAVVVASASGRSAGWYLDSHVTPLLRVRDGHRSWVPQVRELPPSEAFEVLRGVERRRRWAAIAVRARISQLVGWRYHGSDGGRRRVLTQLPLVELRPT
ncbi:hypothetical protein [Thalassiella azotivora]